MRTRLRCLLWVIAVLIIISASGFIYAYYGFYNVAATYPDIGPVAWFLGNTLDHSVERHAAGIKTPPLDDPAMVHAGFLHYQELCIGCHGAPGVEQPKIVAGFNPPPPALVESGDLTPAEIFWITKNGIRMTAMPAWSITLNDDQIWNIVALVHRLPTLSEAQFKAMTRVPPTGPEEK